MGLAHNNIYMRSSHSSMLLVKSTLMYFSQHPTIYNKNYI